MSEKYHLPPEKSFPSTPMAPSSQLRTAEDTLLSQDLLSPSRKTMFQSVIGDISWVGFHTRPDILYAVNMLARRAQNSNEYDFKQALRVAHYIIGTSSLGLVLGSQNGLHLIATVDTSYATHDDMKSHSSWSVFMGGAIMSRSKKQSIMTDSSTLSELVGAHMCVKDIMWARNFLCEVGYPITSPTPLFIDNKSTLKIIENSHFSGRTRHIDIRYFYLHELMIDGVIKPLYLSTTNMISDIGTKALPLTPFTHLRGYMLGYDILDEFLQVIS
jgi:hypothetical protein